MTTPFLVLSPSVSPLCKRCLPRVPYTKIPKLVFLIMSHHSSKDLCQGSMWGTPDSNSGQVLENVSWYEFQTIVIFSMMLFTVLYSSSTEGSSSILVLNIISSPVFNNDFFWANKTKQKTKNRVEEQAGSPIRGSTSGPPRELFWVHQKKITWIHPKNYWHMVEITRI